MGIYDKESKIKRICRLEGINLKEFSELTEVPYGTVKQYSAGDRPMSRHRVDKICSIPRFAQYRNLLLAIDEPISEDIQEMADYHLSNLSEVPKTSAQLLAQLEKVGAGDHAKTILQSLLNAVTNAQKNR